jgi:hypothetical protein
MRAKNFPTKNFPAKNYPAKNYPAKNFFLSLSLSLSLAKKFPSEESSGEEFSASRDFFRAKNYPAKKTPSEESYGQRILRRRIFRPNKKITLARILRQGIIQAMNFLAKNYPAKNLPSEEIS